MSAELKIKCKCGRTIRVYLDEKGKVKYEIKGSGDALIDALEGHTEEEQEEGDKV